MREKYCTIHMSKPFLATLFARASIGRTLTNIAGLKSAHEANTAYFKPCRGLRGLDGESIWANERVSSCSRITSEPSRFYLDVD